MNKTVVLFRLLSYVFQAVVIIKGGKNLIFFGWCIGFWFQCKNKNNNNNKTWVPQIKPDFVGPKMIGFSKKNYEQPNSKNPRGASLASSSSLRWGPHACYHGLKKITSMEFRCHNIYSVDELWLIALPFVFSLKHYGFGIWRLFSWIYCGVLLIGWVMLWFLRLYHNKSRWNVT